MREPNRERKNEIKYKVTLNEEQKEAKNLIIDNQIVVITGRAGCGKSLVGIQAALDFLNKKMCDRILITRTLVEVGDSMGFLPGNIDDKMNPYLEAALENFEKCMDKQKIQDYIVAGKIKGGPINFIRGKTIDDVLILEEAQNVTRHRMEALLTRLGKVGKIIINGDLSQRDIKDGYTGLDFVIELSKHIPEIKWIKLKENHRSDLVGKILDHIYGK